MLYKEYCTEEFDKNGVLKQFDIKCPDNFNFAYDVVDRLGREKPEKTALIWQNVDGEEKKLTFREISELSDKAAAYLTAEGIGKGDCVMVMLKRHWEYWYIICALHKIGAVALPATHMLTAEDIEYRVKAANVKAIICTFEGDVPKHVLAAKESCGDILKKAYNVRESIDGLTRIDTELEKFDGLAVRIDTKSTDPFLMYFTSGTTGLPKAVIHDFSYPLAHIITAVHWHNVSEDGLHLTVADTGWGKASWGKIYGQWLAETAVMVYDFEKFDAEELADIIEKYRVTTFCAPPTVYRFLTKQGVNAEKLRSLRYATTAGEAMNPEIIKRFRELTGLTMMEGYGQTESTLLIANLKGQEVRPGSMGKPTPLYDVRLVDENGEFSDYGEVVVVPPRDKKQYGLFSCYGNDDVLYKKAWSGGIYHTNDIAQRDGNGYFWYVGRKDDIIKSSGYKIGPFEVESVLIKHDAVLECAVIGVPDEIRGTVVKAIVVLTDGYKESDGLARELQQFVKQHTAPYKYPRVIEFVKELPKTISGKTRHTELRARAAAK